MACLPPATPAQFIELVRQSGLPENTPMTNAFAMLAHTPAVSGAALRLVLALLTETKLDARLREMVILRVTQRCGGLYAWIQHVAIAVANGVSEAQVTALESGEITDQLFAKRERAAFALADEVSHTARCSDYTFAAVRGLFSPCETVELLLLIGCFRMISGVMSTLEVEVESPFGMKILDAYAETR